METPFLPSLKLKFIAFDQKTLYSGKNYNYVITKYVFGVKHFLFIKKNSND